MEQEQMKKAQEAQQKAEQNKQQRLELMSQFLDKNAQTRLGGIRAVNADKATAVENIVIANI